MSLRIANKRAQAGQQLLELENQSQINLDRLRKNRRDLQALQDSQATDDQPEVGDILAALDTKIQQLAASI